MFRSSAIREAYKARPLLSDARYWSPSFIATGAWFDADAPSSIELTSGVISQWSDRSGNNRHATQSTAGARPSLIADAVNGRPAVRFDGSDDCLNFDGTFLASTTYSVHAVVVRRATAAVDSFFLGGTGTSNNTNLHLGWPSNTSFRYAHWGNDVQVTVAGYTFAVAEIWSATLDNAGRYLLRNGNSIGGGVASTTTQLSSYAGAAMGKFLSNLFFLGDIGELVLTTGVFTLAERQRLEGYLAHKWGLAGSLPSGHPHISAPPLR